jgi:hypothetical protein
MVLLKILKRNPLPQAKTSDEYVDRIVTTNTDSIKVTDLATLYTTIKSSLSTSEQSTEETITNLARIHVNLSVINIAVEKRIPMMQRNCIKQLPSVVGGCRTQN